MLKCSFLHFIAMKLSFFFICLFHARASFNSLKVQTKPRFKINVLLTHTNMDLFVIQQA